MPSTSTVLIAYPAADALPARLVDPNATVELPGHDRRVLVLFTQADSLATRKRLSLHELEQKTLECSPTAQSEPTQPCATTHAAVLAQACVEGSVSGSDGMATAKSVRSQK